MEQRAENTLCVCVCVWGGGGGGGGGRQGGVSTFLIYFWYIFDAKLPSSGLP